MTFHETWTRNSTASVEMEYGYITSDPRQLSDWQLATELGLGWIKKLMVVREECVIKLYAGKRHWATVYPRG